jgi:hypothetical protein
LCRERGRGLVRRTLVERLVSEDHSIPDQPEYLVDDAIVPVIWDDCKRVSMQNVAGWSNVPVRVLP